MPGTKGARPGQGRVPFGVLGPCSASSPGTPSLLELHAVAATILRSEPSPGSSEARAPSWGPPHAVAWHRAEGASVLWGPRAECGLVSKVQEAGRVLWSLPAPPAPPDWVRSGEGNKENLAAQLGFAGGPRSDSSGYR